MRPAVTALIPPQLQQLLLFLLLTQLHSCSAAKLAVVVQNNLIKESLVATVFDRLVNNYWKFPAFKTNPMKHQFVQATDAVAAMQKVCSSSDLNGVVAVGSCSFVTDLVKLSSSIGVPTVVISKDLCQFNTTNDMSLISTPRASHFLDAAVAVVNQLSASLVSIFYDKFQNHVMLEDFQRMLSERNISSVTFQIDDASSNLTHILANMIKAKIRYNVIFAEPDNVRLTIQQALLTGTLQINYFWIVMDSGIQVSSIEELIPANGSANILMIRESALSNVEGSECTADMMTVFPDCQVGRNSMMELKVVEAVVSFADALQNMSNSALSVSNASCQPLQTWLGGSTAHSLMKQQRQPLSSRDNWLPSNYFLETVGTFHDEFSDPIKFVTSGRFYVENSSLSVTFQYRNRLLVFPNTFVDFKNKSLRICATAARPYTEYSNGTFGIPYGITVDLAKFFAAHLNFTYTIFTPPDNQFGAPNPPSPYFTGCIGMVQKGEADFATPFAITTVRSRVIEYSEEFLFSSNTILVKRPSAESKLWNVFAPLAWDSWVLIVAMFLGVPLVIYILARLSPFSAWNLKLPFAFADEVWLKEYIWSIMGSFLQQGQDFYPFAMSPRVVLAFWWLLTVIIFAAYTGDLTAKLAVTVAKFPIQNLDDLVSMPHYKAMVPRGTNIYAAVLSATEGPLLKLRDQWMVVDTFDICAGNLVTVPDPYLVCVSDLSVSLFYANEYCSRIYNAETYFNPYYLAMAFPQDAYYLPAFDFLIQRSKANGVMGMITGKYIPQTTECGSAANAAAEAAAIPLEGVGGAYILSLALYVCGCFILLLELLWVLGMKKETLQLPGF